MDFMTAKSNHSKDGEDLDTNEHLLQKYKRTLDALGDEAPRSEKKSSITFYLNTSPL